MKIFNEQHEMFRATVRAFVDKEVAPNVEAWEQAGRLPKSVFRRMGELGFLGVEYDEKYGGGGADLLTTAVLHEECARSRSGSFAMAVGVHTDMASPHLYWTGSEPLKEKYLPTICRGERLCAIAVTEPGGGSDVAAIRTRAIRDSAHFPWSAELHRIYDLWLRNEGHDYRPGKHDDHPCEGNVDQRGYEDLQRTATDVPRRRGDARGLGVTAVA